MGMVERLERGSVRGFLHLAEPGSGDGVVLAHGAGANCEAKVLVAVADGLCAAGFHVLRIDLPFRQKRPSGPPFPAVAAADREGLRDAAAELRAVAKSRIVIGGHSYGGRQASMLSAEDESVADALLLLSYPLHPPRAKEQLRTAHFPQVRVPALFVHGTRDPFGLPEEMASATSLLGGAVGYSEVTGAGHDLRSGKFDVSELVVQPLRRLLDSRAA
jgi:predicted alpha/beta-hydrolase family hydrolase